MGNKAENFKITRENAEAFGAIRGQLLDALDDLVELTSRFPVVCVIDGVLFVFTCREDIVSLVDGIGQRVADLRG